MTYATLDEWLDEIENFASRGERLYEEFGPCTSKVRAWLETAWRLGMAAQCELDAERIEKLEKEAAATAGRQPPQETASAKGAQGRDA